ncbi:MAG: N-acetylmuramoyl-L-alanine amidase [Candidatus Ozemobacteraceae bacterium]
MTRILPLISLFFLATTCCLAEDLPKSELPCPSIRPRVEWNAKPALTELMKPQGALRGIVVHHSEGKAPKAGEENSVVQNIQSYHMGERKWGDVAYHFFVCPSGLVLEGRSLNFAGDSGTKYDTQGYEMVCVLGGYMKELPTPEALRALTGLVQNQMKQHHLTKNQIHAHRELASTDCPGDCLYKWFSEKFRVIL